jgi:hypothetical protein
VAPFTRDLRCAGCGREYLVCGASLVPGSQTEALAQFRCSCGEWMGAFVPGSANVERLVVALKREHRLAVEEPLVIDLDLAAESKKTSAA